MHARLGLLDGDIIISDDFSEIDMENYIAEHDGRIGNGDYENVRVENLDDAMAFVNTLMSIAMSDRETGKVTIVVNQRSKEYRSDEVAWFRVIR